MKSREIKRREAWQLTAGVGGVVAGLLLLYGLSERVPPTRIGIMVPLITVAGALWGMYLGAHLAQQQRLEDERRRRHALATILLKVMYQLSAEGGTWPMAFPARTYTEFPEEPDAPPFPSFPKPPRG